MAEPFEMIGNMGNIGGSGDIIGSMPNTLDAMAKGLTNIGQMDMIGLITIGVALLMFGMALMGMLDAMSKRRRRL